MVEHLHPPTLEVVRGMSLQELVRGLLKGSGETEEIARIGNEVRRRVLEDLRAVANPMGSRDEAHAAGEIELQGLIEAWESKGG